MAGVAVGRDGAAAVWQRWDAMEARLAAPLSERMLALAELEPGARVLDLATGRGEPAIPAAKRVGPTGRVVGVDVSAEVLAMARARAEREGVGNLELHVGDALALDALALGDGFAATLCRWGLMYMAEPVAALAAARRLMQPGGKLVLAVWAEPERVSYVDLPRRVLARFTALPELDVSGPGPCRYGALPRLRADVEAAGFRWERAEELEVPVMEAEDAATLEAWARAFGPRRQVEALPAETQAQWAAAQWAEAAAAGLVDGKVRLGGLTRLAVASA